MKFKDIAAMCCRRKYVELYTDEESGERFVSDGTAVFKLEGMPIVSVDELLRLFSVDDKQKRSWFYEESAVPDFLCLADNAPEQLVENFSDFLVLNLLGNELVPVRGRRGILLLNRQYLKPFEKGDYIKFFERECMGRKYIAVKDGFELKAVILPFRVEKDFVERLEDIYSGLLESGCE